MGSSLRDADPSLWEWKFVKSKKPSHNKSNRIESENNFKRPSNQVNRNSLEHISVSYYITNFPPHIETQDLKKICDPFGTVADVYIARKLSKLGKRFAFIRFLKVKDIDEIAKKLCGIWLGNHHLYASVARFDKKSSLKAPMNVNGPSKVLYGNKNPSMDGVNVVSNEKMSYFDKLVGGSRKEVVDTYSSPKVIELDQNDLICYDDASCITLAEVKDITTIPNLYMICNEEGFHDIDIVYMGGTWIQIKFESSKECLSFKKKESMGLYFSQFQSAEKHFAIKERIIWMEIRGLPLCAWTTKALKKISNEWGNFLFTDDDLETCVSIGRVCIKTKIQPFINERVSVKIEGNIYPIFVREVSDWNPVIQKPTDNHSDMGDTEEENENIVDLDMEESDEERQEYEHKTPDNQDLGDEHNSALKGQNASPIRDEQSHAKTHQSNSESLSKPPGFEGKQFETITSQLHRKTPGTQNSCSFSETSKTNNQQAPHKSQLNGAHGFSLLEEFSRFIETAKALGYDMKGSKRDMKHLKAYFCIYTHDQLKAIKNV